MKLAIWIDTISDVREIDGVPWLHTAGTSAQFMTFALAVAAHFSDATILTRSAADGAPLRPVGPLASGQFVGLPFYPSLRDARAFLRAAPATVRRARAAFEGADVAWLFGPHPLTWPMLSAARHAGATPVLGVRQPGMSYWWGRAASLRELLAVPLLAPTELYLRTRGRKLAMTVVGERIARLYRRQPQNTLVHVAATVPVAMATNRSDQLGQLPSPSDASRPWRLLAVGRLEPEKDPLLALDVLRELKTRAGRPVTLSWAGDGRLRAAFLGRAEQLGLAAEVELLGDVEFARLRSLYQQSDLLLHTAKVEGIPQVLLEALSFGLPVVATDAGDIASFFGAHVRVVADRTPESLARAVVALLRDRQTYAELAERGRQFAAEHALEPEAQRVAEFLRRARR